MRFEDLLESFGAFGRVSAVRRVYHDEVDKEMRANTPFIRQITQLSLRLYSLWPVFRLFVEACQALIGSKGFNTIPSFQLQCARRTCHARRVVG